MQESLKMAGSGIRPPGLSEERIPCTEATPWRQARPGPGGPLPSGSESLALPAKGHLPVPVRKSLPYI